MTQREIQRRTGQLISRYWRELTYQVPPDRDYGNYRIPYRIPSEAAPDELNDPNELNDPDELNDPNDPNDPQAYRFLGVPWEQFWLLFGGIPWFYKDARIINYRFRPLDQLFFPRTLIGIVGGELRSKQMQIAHHADRQLIVSPWSGQVTREIKISCGLAVYPKSRFTWYRDHRILDMYAARQAKSMGLVESAYSAHHNAALKRTQLYISAHAENRESYLDKLDRGRVVMRVQRQLMRFNRLVETAAQELRRMDRYRQILGDRLATIDHNKP